MSAVLNGEPLPLKPSPRGGWVSGWPRRTSWWWRPTCPTSTPGSGCTRFVDPVDGAVYLHTQFEPFDAHRVFACFDQPDLKATYTFEVDAPAGWEVVSGARVVAAPRTGSGGRAGGSPLRPGCRPTWPRWWPVPTTPSTGATATSTWVSTAASRWPTTSTPTRSSRSPAAGFDFFESAFGQPYPFGKYDQCFVPEFNFGAMENAGCVTFSERHVFRSKVTEAEREGRADTILHEMAHMWFGDLVTMRWWDDLWLNESFATFASHLAMVEATRFRSAWTTFASAWKVWAYRQDQLPSTHPIVADAPDIEAMKTNFDGITYAKGASVLRQLVAWVGQDEFLAGRARPISSATPGATPSFPTSSARWRRRRAGTCPPGRPSGWRPPGSTRCGPIRDGEDGAITAFDLEQEAAAEHPTLRSHRVARRPLRPGRVRARSCGSGWSSTWSGTAPRSTSLVGRPVPDLVLVNDGTGPTPRSASTRGRWPRSADAPRRASRPAGPRPVLGGGVGHAARRRAARPPLPRHGARQLAGRGRDRRGRGGCCAMPRRPRSSTAIPANRERARRRLADTPRPACARRRPGSDLQLAFARALRLHRPRRRATSRSCGAC